MRSRPRGVVVVLVLSWPAFWMRCFLCCAHGVPGQGYLVARCSWTQLNVSIMDDGRHARTTSHMWVISLAYASDKDMENLKILWKTNVEVCCAAFS